MFLRGRGTGSGGKGSGCEETLADLLKLGELRA